MKKKFKIALSTIILTTTVSYLVQHWFKHSGLEDKTLNKLGYADNRHYGDYK